MKPKANEKNSTQTTEKKKVSKTWEAALKSKGTGWCTYPKFVKLTQELKENEMLVVSS